MIFLTGATGSIGGNLARILAARGVKAKALVRKAEDAQRLRAMGHDPVIGDLATPDALVAALSGCDTLILLPPPLKNQIELEANALSAACDAGLSRVVKISAGDANIASPVPWAKAHALGELALHRSGLRWTILRASAFYQNFEKLAVPIRKGVSPISAGSGNAAFIDAADVAEVAACVLLEHGQDDATYHLTGPQALTMKDIAAALSAGRGKPVRYLDLPVPLYRASLRFAGVGRWLRNGLVAIYRRRRQGARHCRDAGGPSHHRQAAQVLRYLGGGTPWPILLIRRRTDSASMPERSEAPVAGARRRSVGVRIARMLGFVVGVSALLGIGAVSIPAVQDRLVAFFVARQASRDPTALPKDGLRVILCGVAAPSPNPHARSCTVVIAGKRVFVIDAGGGSANNLDQWHFPTAGISAILLTHFHSDHIGDLGEFRRLSWAEGRREQLPVYGPDGVEQVVNGFNLAFAQDDGYRAALDGGSVTGAGLTARPFGLASAGEQRAHMGRRILIDDSGLKITAFQVNHEPVYPAVGYRFDYGGRSVVVSGDTVATANMIAMARGADLLVHEAPSAEMLQAVARGSLDAGQPALAGMMGRIATYHTTPRQAAAIANAADVRLLCSATSDRCRRTIC
ncbi:NmrA family NAD(P)-binding protein [Sphingomonas sp. 22176]|uniref:NmrA family NAD(P)-binding protein n=1 Tax=Sphingomonas sp. 22176 TaxID=3453884 RepID=UPI003F85E0D4